MCIVPHADHIPFFFLRRVRSSCAFSIGLGIVTCTMRVCVGAIFVDWCGTCLRVLVFPHISLLSLHAIVQISYFFICLTHTYSSQASTFQPEIVKDPEGCITRRPLYVHLTEHWRTFQVPCEDGDGQGDEGVGCREDVEKRMKEGEWM